MTVFLASFFTLLFYFSGFFVLWTPLPLFYLSLARRKREWWLSLFLICASSVFFLRGFWGIGYFLFYLLIACFLSLGVWRGWPLLSWGFKSGTAITALLLSAGFFFQQSGLFDILSFVQLAVKESGAIVDKMMTEPQFLKQRQEAVLLSAQMKEWLMFLPKLIPSLLFIFVIAVMGFNIALLGSWAKRKFHLKWGEAFRRLKLPFGVIWGLIGGGALFFLNDYFFRNPFLKIAALNILFALLFVYFIQGAGILSFFLRRFSPLFRFSIYALLLLFLQLLGPVAVGLGIADVWFDFRKIHKSGGNHGSHLKGRH